MIARLALAAAALWCAHWASFQVAALVSRKLPRVEAPRDPDRRPGHMPGPPSRR